MQDPFIELQNDETRRAATLPLEYLNTAVNDKQDEGRDSALLLTKEDIFCIKRYERHALNLPTSLQSIEQVLGYSYSNVEGLEPTDLLLLYMAINEHAQSWDAIENRIKITGVNIDLFARKFVDTGNALLDSIDKMDIAKQLDIDLDHLSVEVIEKNAETRLSDPDKRATQSLSRYLLTLDKEIEKHMQSANELTASLSQFSQTMAVHLIPSITEKIHIASRRDLDQKIRIIEDDLVQLDIDIGDKDKEYRTQDRNQYWGLVGGVLGAIGTIYYFGPKAERIRQERKKFVIQKEHKVQLLRQLRPISASIHSLHLLLQDMQIRTEDARDSSKDIHDLWATISQYIKSSTDELDTAETAKDLLFFYVSFKSVVKPWENIKELTTKLLVIFDDALQQFKLQDPSLMRVTDHKDMI